MSPRDDVQQPESKGSSLVLQATPEMCQYCFDVLVKELKTSSSSNAGRGWLSSNSSSADEDEATMPAFATTIPASAEAPLFVTWDKRRSVSSRDFDLRGCIGTLAPRPLLTAVGEYALTSAFRDQRFDPIRSHEVPQLRVAVSLLVKYENCEHCHDWIVGVHGIIIKFETDGAEFSATYLPEVAREQGWDQQVAVQSLIRKAGYDGSIKDGLLKKIRCTRYQSSKHRLTYQEYVSVVGSDPLKTEKKRNRFVFF
mmetsp:Transcript_2214/g.3094  ORF Transcript_2214/g.3094 Transcript_2214/m.3094 type:complete len:254 (+) Transcript_2214:322-1083(+)